MSLLRLSCAATVALFLLAPLGAQSLDVSIPLDDMDPSVPDTGFGITLAADGVHAYAAIAGNLFGPNNDDVARVDVLAGVQVNTGPTGLYPEDVALTYDSAGAVRHVFVVNSSSNSVTCLTPALVPVATIPLPTCFGFGSYPFGALVSPAQDRLYVTTLGGCGDVFVVDTDPASATFNTLLPTITVFGGGGRPQWGPYPVMVVPTTTYDSGFTLSQGGFATVDVTNPGSPSYHVISPAVATQFAFNTECVVIPGGKVLLSIGYNVLPLVYECDVATGVVTRTLDLNTITGNGLHGLAVNADATVGAITSLNGGDTVFFDVATFAMTGIHDHGPLSQPNDVVFTPDGSRAIVSLQGAPRVDVLKDLPGYDLELAAPASVNLGGTLTYTLDHVESGQGCAIYFSLAGGGPQQIGPFVVYLTDPFLLAFEGIGDLDGDAGASFVVPNVSGLSGQTVFTQAGTVDRDGDLRLSNGAQTRIN